MIVWIRWLTGNREHYSSSWGEHECWCKMPSHPNKKSHGATNMVKIKLLAKVQWLNGWVILTATTESCRPTLLWFQLWRVWKISLCVFLALLQFSGGEKNFVSLLWNEKNYINRNNKRAINFQELHPGYFRSSVGTHFSAVFIFFSKGEFRTVQCICGIPPQLDNIKVDCFYAVWVTWPFKI